MGDFMHSENEVVYLYLDDIIPNRFQPRELFDERALKELAVSIKEHGVIQPIIVRKNGEKYEIIAGERRYKASALAGLTKIPAIIRDLDDKESSKVALLENLQRKNLNPIEEAKTYQKILEIDQMTQEELAKTMGKSQSAVANKLRLLSLSEGVQNALLNAKISERHARTLLSLNDKEDQDRLVKQIIQNRITVRELERIIKQEKDMGEEIEQERPRSIDRPSGNSDIFNEPEFDLDDRDHKVKPPMPDTMINFEDVTKELETKDSLPRRDGDAFRPNLDAGINQSLRTAPDTYFEQSDVPKFINYGEIDPDEEGEDDDSPEKQFKFTSTPNYEDEDLMSLDKRHNQNDSKSSSLDSLLNLNSSNSYKNRDDKHDSNKYRRLDPLENNDDFDDGEDSYEYESFTDDLENDSKFNRIQDNKESSHSMSFDETLFRTPTIEEFGQKNKVSSIKANSLRPSSYRGALKREAYSEELDEENEKERKTKNFDIQYGINAIRDTVRHLEKESLQLDIDEMNFENSYQIVIKIQKPTVDDNE